MEKYYTVKPDSMFYKKYLDYKAMSENVNNAFVEFAKENNFETHKYYQLVNGLHICPTDNDAEKFGKFFKKNSHGIFKKNSPLAKEWVKKCQLLELKTPIKPRVAFEFRAYGSTSSRLFMINNILYASLSALHDLDNVNGFEELKASEFYKVVEEYEESVGK